MPKKQSCGEQQVTPVSILSLATSCVQGLSLGLGKPAVRRGPEIIISDLEPPEPPRDPIGLKLYPLAEVCQEETSATNGVYSYYVGELPGVGQICALAVLRENLEASSWKLQEVPRAPNGYGPISRHYQGWDRAKLVEEDWGDFVLLGPEHAIFVARAAPCCPASDQAGRELREEMADRLTEVGANPRPSLLWECDRMITPTIPEHAKNDSYGPCDDH